MTNRIGRMFGVGVPPLDENGMEATPVLGRDEPDAQTARALAWLGDEWRKAREGLRAAIDPDGDTPEEYRPARATRWRGELDRIEREAARLVLLERSAMFRDESDPPAEFEPVYLEYQGGRSIYVAPGGAPDCPVVQFHPREGAAVPCRPS
ncbi:hypothetical protein [Paludisphaera sp.]|uniref:hypothetical protein n=1 Tax=Paludisphaera sp. TaxID=2017432 RepID=UPI00301B7C8D